MPSCKTPLPFHNLSERHSGLTYYIAEGYTEAARVCLDRHHSSPVEFAVGRTGCEVEVECEWNAADQRTRNAWANETDTTEICAYALALAGVEVAEGWVAVMRAETKTGADYYLAPKDSDPEDFETCHRLEISGVDGGSNAVVKNRLKEKVAQAAGGKSKLPALAAVVGFKEKVVLIEAVVV